MSDILTADQLTLICKASDIRGTIRLDGSKSITNRVLLIKALSKGYTQIHGPSDSDDSRTLIKLLSEIADGTILNTGHAGTTYRFLTAYLSMQPGTQILEGSERMHQRPIGPLVEALRQLGAQIDYLENEGYPPLRIGAPQFNELDRLSIDASMSSQYLSALLMIAPMLPEGLQLHLEGEIVSRSYLEMTLSIMQEFGISYRWADERTIDIPAQTYLSPDSYTVEADWSAASYYFAIAALSNTTDLILLGLSINGSAQGDADIVNISRQLGVEVTAVEGGKTLTKQSEVTYPQMLEVDFIRMPDIAQTVAVMVGALGLRGLYTGLQTLKIKETDRIAALKTELEKIGVLFSELPARFSPKSGISYFMQEGKASIGEASVSFSTYKDHRMAMAFAPLAMLFPITIEKPGVVSKSYRRFWEDLQSISFEVV